MNSFITKYISYAVVFPKDFTISYIGDKQQIYLQKLYIFLYGTKQVCTNVILKTLTSLLAEQGHILSQDEHENKGEDWILIVAGEAVI